MVYILLLELEESQMSPKPLAWRVGQEFDELCCDDWIAERGPVVFKISAYMNDFKVSCFIQGQCVDKFDCLLVDDAKIWSQRKFDQIFELLLG